MHKNVFSATYGEEGDNITHYKGNSLIEHMGSDVMTAGVCPLGKLGAWIILIWNVILLVTIGIIYQNNNQNTPDSNIYINKVNRIMGIINCVLLIILFILTLVMNSPLFIRTIPFFYVEIIICFLLIGVEIK